VTPVAVGVTSLGYIGFETARLEAWLPFASEVLGLEVGDARADGAVPLRMDDRAARLVLHPGAGERLAYLGWEVADGAALEALHARLAAAGLETRAGTADERAVREVGGLVHSVDAAGHPLELFTRPEPAAEAFRAPYDGLRFRTGALGLGHLVVHVDDVASVVAFYEDRLGFRRSDRLDEALYFLRCNARHHSIGIAHLAGPPRVLHVMVEVDDLDAVGCALDRCLARGIRTSMLGLHSNDRMLSFYLETPSGFEIEYGWNGRLVDDATWEPAVIDRPSVWGHHQLDPAHPPGRRAFRRVTP
jgi:2,3-dihydroxybiphenyl 1,2-dioxygenase